MRVLLNSEKYVNVRKTIRFFTIFISLLLTVFQSPFNYVVTYGILLWIHPTFIRKRKGYLVAYIINICNFYFCYLFLIPFVFNNKVLNILFFNIEMKLCSFTGHC